jgi:hypothetical protein
VSEQKRIERLYLDEARRASSIFPTTEPVARDPLDFLFKTPTGYLGVEITELCDEKTRREGARLGYVVPKAHRLYSKRQDAVPVSVSPVLSRDAEEMHVDDLASGLSEFVYNHRDADENFSWDRCEDMPRGFSLIGVYPPMEFEPEGEWRNFRAFSTTRALRESINGIIARKNGRLAHYRQVATVVWLLIVNDLFLGPGEMCVQLESLGSWSFDFGFDKVLMFERQPGGTGEVIELLRAEPDRP